LGLKIHPKPLPEDLKWELVVYSDSDWAGDKDNRRSVTGFMLYLNDVLIAWRSKLQKTVSLSSSEAEFYACGEAVKEVPFVVQILQFLGISVQLPVIVHVDNIGAIFMSENVTSSTRTRHMDTRWHFVREKQEEGLIKIVFVPSAGNISDILTKNVTGEVYHTHLGKFVVKSSYVDHGCLVMEVLMG
jgi:hypothetical protein